MKHEKLIAGLLAAILLLNATLIGILIVEQKKTRDYIREETYSVLQELWELRTYINVIELMIEGK